LALKEDRKNKIKIKSAEEALELLDDILEVVGKLPKEVVLPKFIEKTFPDYKLVPVIKEYEVHIPVKKEKPFDVLVPVLKEVPREVYVEQVKIIRKEELLPWPKPKYYDVEVLSNLEIQRIREFVDVLLPQLISKMDAIVRWVPKEEKYVVNVPEPVKVPYDVSEPVFVKKNIAEPVFTKVQIISPVIVDKGMSLDDWNKEAEKNTELIENANKNEDNHKRRIK